MMASMDEGRHSITPSGPGQASTGDTPRSLVTSTRVQSTHSATPTTNNPQLSKRRRGAGVVTPNACTECRKKRAKCDGKKPCSRCQGQKSVKCVYQAPVRQSKEHLRHEIESLRQRQQASDTVFAALLRPRLWEEVLARLRGGHPVESISEWLKNAPLSLTTELDAAPRTSVPAFAQLNTPIGPVCQGVDPALSLISSPPGSSAPNVAVAGSLPAALSQAPSIKAEASPWPFSVQSQASSNRSSTHPDAMNWTADTSHPPMSRVASGASGGSGPEGIFRNESGNARFHGHEQVLSPFDEPKIKALYPTWTKVTTDLNLVQHLLALYFCWEYPTFASLSKEHFLRDFQEGRRRYCSSILVNALLSLGCRFSSHPMTRANPNEPSSSGDHFFKECQRLFYQEADHHSLTTIQALGIMAIREASCGRDSESWYLAGQSIRLAVEMGLHRTDGVHDEDELAVQSATFWGAFALDHAWSLATGSLPQCSYFPQLPPKPAIMTDIEASLWVSYTDDGAGFQRSSEQPSNVRSVYKCFCELSELVHRSLYVLHSPGRPLTARELLNIYTQYLNWYDCIPEVLRLGHNFTPAVLFTHMYYHFAILLLFRPLIKLRIIGSKVSPRDVCSQAADAIQSLSTSYSQLYTLRRTPSFVPYFVLTSAIMHLALAATSIKAEPTSSNEEKIKTAASIDPRVSRALNQGIADLAEMAPCHRFAEQALNIMRYLAKKWKIEVDIDKDKTPPEDYETLVRPYSSSLNFFAPNVQAEDLVCGWGSSRDSEVMDTVRDSSDKVREENLESPLFWPFPMQGRPLLLTGSELEQAGFVVQCQ